MTCIIALEHKGRAYLGADSFIGHSDLSREWAQSKIFQIGPFLIGSAGSVRVAQVAHYLLTDIAIQRGPDDVGYLVTEFVEPLRAVLKEYGAAKNESGEDSTANGWLTLVYRNRVYNVQSDFQVSRYRDGFICDGAGELIATGAMAALEHLPPRKRIRRALQITAAYSPWVRGPFQVVRYDPAGKGAL